MKTPDGFVEVSCETSNVLMRGAEVRVLSIERHGELGEQDSYEVQTWGSEGRNGVFWVSLISSTASEDGTHKCKHLVPGKGITARFKDEQSEVETDVHDLG